MAVPRSRPILHAHGFSARRKSCRAHSQSWDTGPHPLRRKGRDGAAGEGVFSLFIFTPLWAGRFSGKIQAFSGRAGRRVSVRA